jgi:toxin-antitoxin system PIN domain toxin
MMLVDVNVLLYVVNDDAPQHDRVRKWWEAVIAREERLGLTWIVIVGFLRLATHARVFRNPLTPDEAIGKIDTWLKLPNVRIVAESDEHWQTFKQVFNESEMSGNLATDAHLATIALGYGAIVASCDSDFARIQQLRWENPLSWSTL